MLPLETLEIWWWLRGARSRCVQETEPYSESCLLSSGGARKAGLEIVEMDSNGDSGTGSCSLSAAAHPPPWSISWQP